MAILADQPLCSDELDDQLSSLLCQLIHQPLVVVSAPVCNSAGCSAEIGWIPGPGLGSLRAHVLIDEHASRARPSSAVEVFEIEYCACVKISPSVWGILGDAYLTPKNINFEINYATTNGLENCLVTPGGPNF